MAFEYVDVEQAQQADGLRMVVVGGLPSPWGEAAKGILHVKKIDWLAVRLVYDDPGLADWAGGRSGPVAFLDDDKPRTGWSEILQLAERLAPQPSLIPADPEARALMFGLAHEILAENGLCWSRRLQLIDAGLSGEGGFAPEAAHYLSKKYGYRAGCAGSASQRVVDVLGVLATRLHAQQAMGSDYYIGDSLTALDIYSATALALLVLLPDEQCPMHPTLRRVFDTLDDKTAAALDPILLEHRDRVYAKYLELPLSL